MATSRRICATAVALALSACATGRSAEAGARALTLLHPDGSETTLEDLWRDRDATVLVFWTATCPCVRRYQERVDALLDAYPASRVRVVGVASNAGESFEEIQRVARERDVRIPILRDEGGRVAAAVGARSTPTVALIDRSGAVRFLGWIDNERPPGTPGREPWLERALQGVLEGDTGFAPRSPTWGCSITRSLFKADAGSSGSCCTLH